MKTESPPRLSPVEARFVAAAAEIAESFSFSGTLAQIYALLYMRPAPLSLGEIALTLGMSKGHASVNLRILESWGAVRPSFVPGTRKDHYEPVRDIKSLALKRIEEGLTRRVALAEERLDALAAGLDAPGGGPKDEVHFLKSHLKSLRGDLATAKKVLQFLPKLSRVRSLLR